MTLVKTEFHRIRLFTPADVPAVTDLLNRSLVYDAFSEIWVHHKVVEDPDYDPSLAMVALDKGHIVGFGQAVVRSDRSACLKMVAVDPVHRRKGIARGLLDLLEQALTVRATGISVLYSRPNYFLPGLDPRYTPAVSLFLSRGYQRTGDGFNMSVDLTPESDLERHLAREIDARLPGLRLIRPALDQSEKVHAWLGTTGCSTAWQYQALHAFRLPLRGPGAQSGLILAEMDGMWVGFAAYDAVLPGWFGPEWVREDLRGRRIGLALLCEALRAMRADGYTRAEIGLVGPLPFYAKAVGAVVSRTWWFFRKDFPAPAHS